MSEIKRINLKRKREGTWIKNVILQLKRVGGWGGRKGRQSKEGKGGREGEREWKGYTYTEQSKLSMLELPEIKTDKNL